MGYIDLSPSNEGVWTPSIAGTITRGNHTYTSERNGWWAKRDKLINAWFAVSCTKDAAISGNIIIDGLPFPIKNSSFYVPGISLAGYVGFLVPSGYTHLLVQGTFNTDSMLCRFYGSTGMPQTCTQAHLGASLTVRGSISYLID